MQVFFPKGLPGFEDYKNFELREEQDAPLANLNSLDNQDIGFVLLRPHVAFNDYHTKIEIKNEEAKLLGIKEESQVDIWLILTLCLSDITKTTANLRAPLLINHCTKKGIQLILENEDYSYRQPLFITANHPRVNRKDNFREGRAANACFIQKD